MIDNLEKKKKLINHIYNFIKYTIKIIILITNYCLGYDKMNHAVKSYV